MFSDTCSAISDNTSKLSSVMSKFTAYSSDELFADSAALADSSILHAIMSAKIIDTIFCTFSFSPFCEFLHIKLCVSDKLTYFLSIFINKYLNYPNKYLNHLGIYITILNT